MVILMKKKILILIIVLILFSGCMKKEEKKQEEVIPKEEVVEEEVPTYQDLNNTPIAFYHLKGNTLEKVTSIYGNYDVLDDVDLVQVYLSNEPVIPLNKSFASSYYDTWNVYNTERPIKVGFTIQGTLQNNQSFFYHVLTPDDTLAHADTFMAYLYDDYVNQGKSFYSHIEPYQYTDTTLYTAIKLQCGGSCKEILSPVTFTVFTYDSEDDFLDGVYRGNSKYSVEICMHGDC